MNNKIKLFFFKLVGIFFCIISISCENKKTHLRFEFKEIQDIYNKELLSKGIIEFNPFYVKSDFYGKVESQLNELIKDADYCSTLIISSINSNKCTIAVIYNIKNEIYYNIWKNDGEQRFVKIQEPYAMEILKQVPRKGMSIIKSQLTIFDGSTKYLIKKVKHKTYYYANHYGPDDNDYKQLLNLFSSAFQKSKYTPTSSVLR